MLKDTIYKGEIDFSKIKRLNPKQIGKIRRYIEGRPHEIYGSFASSAWGSEYQREPHDLDLQARYVDKVARQMTKFLRESGYNPKLHFKPEWGAQEVQLFNKATQEWDTIIDIQPLDEHQDTKMEFTGKRSLKPIKKDGLYIQHPLDQLNRKENSVKNPNMPQHRVEKDTYDYIRTQTDLIESEKVKKNAQLYRGDMRAVQRHKRNIDELGDPVSSGMLAMSKSRYKQSEAEDVSYDKLFINKKHLQKAMTDPVPPKAEKQYYEAAQQNPNVNLDDIDVDSKGNVWIIGKQQTKSKSAGFDGLIKR